MALFRTVLGPTAFLATLITSPAFAGEPGAVAWMLDETDHVFRAEEIGKLSLAASEMRAGDPLALDAYAPSGPFDVPTGTARVYGFYEPDEERVAQVAVVFSDAAPVCGSPMVEFDVDSETGALLDQAMLDEIAAITADGTKLRTAITGGSLSEGVSLVTLPSGAQFPAFSTGWGAGTYPVVSLKDGADQTLAIFFDFMGKNAGGDWLLPEACPAS